MGSMFIARRAAIPQARNEITGQDQANNGETTRIMLVHTVHLISDKFCKTQSDCETSDYPAGKKHGAFFENHPENRCPRCSKRETHANFPVSLLNSIGHDSVQSCRGEKKRRCRK
jgi:hypothetical protein